MERSSILKLRVGDTRFLGKKLYSIRKRELKGAELGNSRILIDGNGIYLLLTIRRNVAVNEHKISSS